MTKFRDMTYTRPDYDGLYGQMQKLLKDAQDAPAPQDLFSALEELDRLSNNLATQVTLCQIRHTIDTRDAFYEKEQDIVDEALPRFQGVQADLARIVLSSPHKAAVVERYGQYFLDKLAVAQKVFKPEILEDLVQENKLATEYDKLIASAEIDFEGEKRNLSAMGPFLQSPDRDTRKRASLAFYGWLSDRQDKLDSIYDQLVKLRHTIGKKLGFSNFIPVAYARMNRTDWTQEDAKVYRAQIASDVVPLAQKLYKKQAQRIGIKDMKFYDVALEYLSGNPKPQGEEDYLVKKAQRMYHELSPETGAFFDTMVSQELMDLTTKPGKAGGGYMTFLPDYKVPFIFSNFNGTAGDVDVLTHEAGHAFQGWLQRDVSPSFLKEYTMEVAEIHSMSMEFFTHPWMEGFFGPDTEKYYDSHVAEAIKFLPYGASVDELQEWVYEHPEASPQERRAKYREIERKYLPHLDYDGIEYLENGGRWQRQAHIYGMPFYYLDYTLAQVVALQYLTWDMKDHQKAWQSYLTVCKKAGLLPFKELLPAAGLKNPFEPGAIKALIPGIEAYLDSLDQEKIK